jgi:hypothetical protein
VDIPWQGKKCILCLNEASLTVEHLIPQALGGILTSDLLCGACNSSLGASFEAAARSDPSIRIAVWNLRARIPNLAEKLTENQTYLGSGPGGTERGVIRNGEFRIRSRIAKDGSLIQPSDDARKSVEKILRKSGSGMAPIEEALRLLDDAPENERVQVAPGLEVEKWSIEKLDFDFKGNRPMSPLVPLKIAFEFLACHIGTAIYDDAPQFCDLRQVLRESIEVHECFRVDWLNAAEYKPFHGICFEGNDPHARVLIRLFGWLAFRVHFLRLGVGGPRFVYTHYLDTNREDIRMLEPAANTLTGR